MYEGKTLDEIDIADCEVDSKNSEDESISKTISKFKISIIDHLEKMTNESSPESIQEIGENRKEDSKKDKIIRVRWTEEQKKVMKDFFKDHIKKKRPPKNAKLKFYLRKI